ncbi:hypothetical protein N7519_004865 [Penicillium mononematosum]|uniref:uncharacterized protein n=1 Tax=Penicillium mononematosum TaxID=268346 RepID=UPI0025475990|nr:uncharacterized protein N7519_004865 [Penicillium mononematosum]KAJ6189957.1 hypothetical protein N7519_004865 [Penicillium mononematosum]
MHALKNGDITSVASAARIYKVPRLILRDRLNSHTQRGIIRILSIDTRGLAPRPSIVREIANLLLKKRGTTPVLSIGEK